jgi:hypothetical protein
LSGIGLNIGSSLDTRFELAVGWYLIRDDVLTLIDANGKPLEDVEPHVTRRRSQAGGEAPHER